MKQMTCVSCSGSGVVMGLIYFEYVALFLVKIGPLTNSDLLRFRYPTNDCSNYFRCLLVSDYRKISRETFPDYGTAQRHNTNIVMTMKQEQIETVFSNALSNQVQNICTNGSCSKIIHFLVLPCLYSGNH